MTFLTCGEVKSAPAKKSWPGYFGLEAREDFAADGVVAFAGAAWEFFGLYVRDERDGGGFFADEKIDHFFDKSAIVGFEAEFVFAGVAAGVEEAADVEADERARVCLGGGDPGVVVVRLRFRFEEEADVEAEAHFGGLRSREKFARVVDAFFVAEVDELGVRNDVARDATRE